jgi:hypothetical protein
MSPANVARRLTVLALAALSLLLSRTAAAEVALCLDVRAPAAEIQGLRKLVEVEVGRHPSHRLSTDGCRSTLEVELFEAAGARYLTARIDREVPVRFILKEPLELGDRVSEAVKLCLHNDPVYLTEDITHYSAVQRLGLSLGVRARTNIRLELFEVTARGGTNTVFAPGMALGMTRGSGNWQVLGRLYFGSWPAAVPGTDRALQAIAGIDGGLTYEFLEKDFWSPYVSACLGGQFLRYGGRELATDTKLAHVNHLGLAASARAGVRFFRWHGFDLDVFAQGYLPLFVTRDADGALFGDQGLYTPSVQLGLGVGF